MYNLLFFSDIYLSLQFDLLERPGSRIILCLLALWAGAIFLHFFGQLGFFVDAFLFNLALLMIFLNI